MVDSTAVALAEYWVEQKAGSWAALKVDRSAVPRVALKAALMAAQSAACLAESMVVSTVVCWVA